MSTLPLVCSDIYIVIKAFVFIVKDYTYSHALATLPEL